MVYLFPAGCTDELELVDGGYGCLIRVEVGRGLGKRLGQGDNLEKWYFSTLTASERRVLVTVCVVEAVACSDALPNYCRRLFETTGSAMTAGGSRDERIILEGLSGSCNFMDGDTDSNEENI